MGPRIRDSKCALPIISSWQQHSCTGVNLPYWFSFQSLSHSCKTIESISNNLGALVWDLAAWQGRLDPLPRGDSPFCLITVASGRGKPRHSDLETDSGSEVDRQCRGGAQETGWRGDSMHRSSFEKLWKDITNPNHTPGIPPQTPSPPPSVPMSHHSLYREQGSLAPEWHPSAGSSYREDLPYKDSEPRPIRGNTVSS